MLQVSVCVDIQSLYLKRLIALSFESLLAAEGRHRPLTIAIDNLVLSSGWLCHQGCWFMHCLHLILNVFRLTQHKIGTSVSSCLVLWSRKEWMICNMTLQTEVTQCAVLLCSV